jgi:hypothetical protein
MTHVSPSPPTSRRKRPISFLLVSCLFALTRPASACNCGHFPTKTDYAKATAVFSGKVVDISRGWSHYDESNMWAETITIEVDRIWKGVNSRIVSVEEHGTSCDVSFNIGQRYMIYGSGNGTLYVDQCSGTVDIGWAKQAIQALGPGTAPPATVSRAPKQVWIGLILFSGVLASWMLVRPKKRVNP